MFVNSIYKDFSARTSLGWFSLAFLAGSVNVGGYLACHRFVTHVTGFATLFGVAFVRANWIDAIGMLSVPIYFLLGVVTSAVLVDRQLHLGRRPHYAAAMALVAGSLFLACALGQAQVLGKFGADGSLGSDYLLLALLCGASGLQNAAITTSSGSTVRLTHLTGLTTDLGTGLVRAFVVRGHKKRYAKELRATNLRIGTVASFIGGSTVGAALFLRFGYLGFLLPAVIATVATVVALLSRPAISVAATRRYRDEMVA